MIKSRKKLLSRESSNDEYINIVHLGLGSFYRAFACNYYQKMNSRKPGSVGVAGVSLKTPHLITLLKAQGGLFTAIEKGQNCFQLKLIDMLKEVIFAPEDPGYVLKLLSKPEVSLVTLTVTEKGYCLIPQTGELDLKNPDIVFDLNNSGTPRSAIGYLTYALDLRRKKGFKPFTCMSCDNLQNNGRLLSKAIHTFAKEIDPNLNKWIDENCTFPSTMVDRIVPSITPSDITFLNNTCSYEDRALVVHEPYSYWVIQDSFVEGSKLEFEKSGVQLVSNVEPYEKMKLRCLNGSHSALAYLGFLSGFKTIFDTVSNSTFESFLKLLWKNEIIPTIAPPNDIILSDYVIELLTRYKNKNIEHLTEQIASDGSQKLPQRLLGTINDNLNLGRSITLLCESVAGWIRYTGGIDESGKSINVSDPMSERLLKIHTSNNKVKVIVEEYLAINEIFPTSLKSNIAFKTTLEEALSRQIKIGTIRSLEKVLR